MYFTTYELLSRVRRRYDATWAIPFVGGAAGVIMWGSYYPLDMVKSRSMAEVANAATTASGITKTSSLPKLFRTIYKEGGIGGFYKGVQPAVRAGRVAVVVAAPTRVSHVLPSLLQLIRAFFTHATVFMAYEAVLHLATIDNE